MLQLPLQEGEQLELVRQPRLQRAPERLRHRPRTCAPRRGRTPQPHPVSQLGGEMELPPQRRGRPERFIASTMRSLSSLHNLHHPALQSWSIVVCLSLRKGSMNMGIGASDG